MPCAMVRSVQARSLTTPACFMCTCTAQGEDQKKLDVVSNEVFCNCLRASGRTVSVHALLPLVHGS